MFESPGKNRQRTCWVRNGRPLPEVRRPSGACVFLCPRLKSRHELLFAVADQVLAAHALQRRAQHWPVVGIVVAQESLVQAANLEPARNRDGFRIARDAPQRVLARVVHRRRRGHRPRQKRLHLVGTVAVFLQPQRELEHVLVGRAGMRGDEVRDQVLLFAGRLREAVEELLELVVRADPGFIIFDSGPSPMASGAILRYPPVWCCASSLTYSGDSIAKS